MTSEEESFSIEFSARDRKIRSAWIAQKCFSVEFSSTDEKITKNPIGSCFSSIQKVFLMHNVQVITSRLHIVGASM